MEKVNFIQPPIKNPVKLPLFGTGYRHSVDDGFQSFTEMLAALSSINTEEAFVNYAEQSFVIVEKKQMYRHEIDSTLPLYFIDFEDETMRDCVNLATFVWTRNKLEVERFIENHNEIWHLFKFDNPEFMQLIEEMGLK